MNSTLAPAADDPKRNTPLAERVTFLEKQLLEHSAKLDATTHRLYEVIRVLLEEIGHSHRLSSLGTDLPADPARG